MTQLLTLTSTQKFPSQLTFKLTFLREGDTHRVVNLDVLESVANLLEVDPEFLVRSLTQTNVTNQGNFFHCQAMEILI